VELKLQPSAHIHVLSVEYADLHVEKWRIFVISGMWKAGTYGLFRLGSGTSYYSSASVGNFRASVPELAVVTESTRLYRELHNNGHDIGDYHDLHFLVVN